MRASVYLDKNTAWSRWCMAALMMALAVPLAAYGADRMVLCEETTDTS